MSACIDRPNRVHKGRCAARIRHRLCPKPHLTACSASPNAPLSGLRPSRPSILMSAMATTRPSFNVVAMSTFTPNSYGVLALPLLMHSTSGAYSVYSLFLSSVRRGQDAARAVEQVLDLGLVWKHVQLALLLAVHRAHTGAQCAQPSSCA